ncbi:MAG: DUF2520 domain-containing protein [Bacteroidota bacterium]
MKIVLLGYGNVAAHLVHAFQAHPQTEVVQIFSRSSVNEEGLPPVTNDLNQLKEADVYIIAISDNAIKEFSRSLPLQGQLVVHTSGSVSIKSLSAKNRRGIFYPLQTFSRGRSVDFSTVPICIEAVQDGDQQLLMELAGFISENVVAIDSKQRRTLHLAAVYVNNFTNHLYQVSEEILAQRDLDFSLLRPLILETAGKMESLPPGEAQTGPAVRKDDKTIKKHLKLLRNKQHKNIYKVLTKSIQRNHGKKL